jgi:hypothetical protein
VSCVRNYKCLCSGSLCCVCGLLSLSSYLFFVLLIYGVFRLHFFESSDFLFSCGCFPGTTPGIYLLSGTYLNKLNVSMVPSDRVARSKGSIRVCASLPEDGSRAGLRNVVFLF